MNHFKIQFLTISQKEAGSSRYVLLQMSLKNGVPFVHTVDLMLILALTRASSQITFSPFTVTSCQLFDTNLWMLTIIAINIIAEITSLTLFWSTMGKLFFIIESASLVTTIEVTLHTCSIDSEFLDPGIL